MINRIFTVVLLSLTTFLHSADFVTDVFFQTSNQEVSPMIIGIEAGFMFKKRPWITKFRKKMAHPSFNPVIFIVEEDPELYSNTQTVLVNLFQPEFSKPEDLHNYNYFANQLFLFIGLVMIEHFDGLDHHSLMATEHAARETLEHFTSLRWKTWLEQQLTSTQFQGVADDFSPEGTNFNKVLVKKAIQECLSFQAYLIDFVQKSDMPTSCCPSSKVSPDSCAKQMDKIKSFVTTLRLVFCAAKRRLWPNHGLDYMHSLIYSMTGREIRKTLFELMPIDVGAFTKTSVGCYFD